MAEKEVFKVEADNFCVRGRDDTVEKDLGGCEISGFGGDFARVVDFVAANGDADAARFFLSGSIGDDDANIGGGATGWYFGSVDPAACVGAFVFFVSLEEATKFVAHACFPEFAVGALEEIAVFGELACVGMDSFEGKVFWHRAEFFGLGVGDSGKCFCELGVGER